MIIGGFRFVTSGDSSRHGDVSLEDAVLDPPPPPPFPLPYTELLFSIGDGITFARFDSSFEPLALTETVVAVVVVAAVAVVPTFSGADDAA